jgi:aminoglycoside phosphotransferase
MDYPKKIENFINQATLKPFSQGQSLAILKTFEKDNQCYVLKIQPSSDESQKETNALKALSYFHLAPKVIISMVYQKNHYILMEKHPDKPLEAFIQHKPIDTILDIALDGLKRLSKLNHLNWPNYALDDRLKDAYHRIKSGQVKTLDVSSYTAPFKDPMALYYYLLDHKPLETKTFVHGDYCLDNILSDGEKVTGFIDLGRSGMSDIYQDLALLVRELKAYDEMVIEKISDKLFELDKDKLHYYMLLDELF